MNDEFEEIKMQNRLRFLSKKDGCSPREMEIEEGRVFQDSKQSKEDIVPRPSIDVQGNVRNPRI